MVFALAAASSDGPADTVSDPTVSASAAPLFVLPLAVSAADPTDSPRRITAVSASLAAVSAGFEPTEVSAGREPPTAAPDAAALAAAETLFPESGFAVPISPLVSAEAGRFPLGVEGVAVPPVPEAVVAVGAVAPALIAASRAGSLVPGAAEGAGIPDSGAPERAGSFGRGASEGAEFLAPEVFEGADVLAPGAPGAGSFVPEASAGAGVPDPGTFAGAGVPDPGTFEAAGCVVPVPAPAGVAG
ncbi:hypothetical protein OG225_31995 [Nocardia sp. NBC_01377]|uniref:hypothetical protein n=1 Tax=Nocardia sp. NBC_01377 TaxID=2903595 RepID=UPI003244164C